MEGGHPVVSLGYAHNYTEGFEELCRLTPTVCVTTFGDGVAKTSEFEIAGCILVTQWAKDQWILFQSIPSLSFQTKPNNSEM